MSAHGKHGPSGIQHGWGLCPSYESKPSGPAAENGSRKHALLEWWVRAWLSSDPHTPVAPWPTEVSRGDDEGEGPYRILSTDVYDLKPVIDWLSKHLAMIGAREGAPGYLVYCEEKVRFGPAFGYNDPDDFFGRLDLALVTPQVVEIVDYKSGFNPVSPVENLQLYLYDVGLRSDPRFDLLDCPRVCYTILQPTGIGQSPAKSWDPIDQELRRLEMEVRGKIDFAVNNPQVRVPGKDQCNYCVNAAGGCPEHLAWVASLLTSPTPLSSPLPLSTSTEEIMTEKTQPLQPKSSVEEIVDEVEGLASLDPAQLSPEEAAHIIGLADIVIPLFSAVKDTWRAKMVNGEKLPGWKLVPGKRSREYRLSEEEMREKCSKNWKLKKAEYTRESFLTPAQLEKVLATRVSDRQLKSYQEMIVWKDGKPILAPEDDPRPAIAVPHFDPVQPADTPATTTPATTTPATTTPATTTSQLTIDDLI